LIEAFAWTCPRPFVEALDSTGLSLDGYQELLGQLGLLAAPPLHRIETISGPPPVPLDRSPDPERQAALAAVGQGELTVTPLQMARLTAAIANQGNAPPFHLADAYRSPGESRWRDLSIPLLQPALLRPEVALRMRQAMQFAAENSPLVQQAGYEDLAAQGVTLYGHASIAYSGRQQYASWFLGFIDLPDGTSVVAVVVTEDAQTPDEAAVIAGDAFRAVTAALQQPASDTARQP
jgi:peptidoglycan glycosyltransferase